MEDSETAFGFKQSPFKSDILIVDDNPTNLRLLARFLGSSSYNPRFALSGEEALRAARVRLPDMVLLDINMPGMSGYEVCQKLHAEHGDTCPPVIFVSALGEAIDKVRAFEVGGVDYLTKPFSNAEIIVRINNHLNIRRLQRELEEANEMLERRVKERTKELERQIALFDKFVPEIFISSLKDSPKVRATLAREGVYTILSCDIRDFTGLSESLSSAESYTLLNSLFSVVEAGIHEFGGFVYQFMGDGILALFSDEEGSTDQPVSAALAVQTHILPKYNAERREQKLPPIAMGIGLNTGQIAIGITGTEHRLDACAVGSAINLAVRCESLTREFHEDIIISEFTLAKLSHPERITQRSLGFPRIKGIVERIELFGISARP